ncbi:nitrate reductase molybdenum cofactor assembly chaperone [Variovorax sp. WDL1]|nr:nitrate reductase molybdenum cofactor assembly chaperone [Variovorax sp. WDL1]
MLGDAPGEQAGQAQVHQPPRKGVEKEMPTLARLQQLGQQGLGRRQGGPALLDLEQRPDALELRGVVAAGIGPRQLPHDGIGQRARQRHAPAVPARHGGLAAARAPYPGRHVVHPYQLQQPAAEEEAVARFHAGDEAFLHAADPGAAQVLHGHAGVADDGADVHAVPARQARIGHAPDALGVGHRASVVGVGRQRGPALRHEVQAPLPALARQPGIRDGGAHLRIEIVRHEAAAERDRDQVLHQHVQRLRRRSALLDAALRHGVARGGTLHDLDAVRGHERDARRPPRRVARAAGTLQQPRHAFGRADLQHALHRQEVHAEVQAGGADHSLERAGFQAQFHPLAYRAVQRAVVQRDLPGPLGPRLEQGLVPDLGQGARVGEDQRARAGGDLPDDLRQHGEPEVPAPWKAFGAPRQQRVDEQLLGHFTLHQHAVAAGQQGAHGVLQIAERRRHAPGAEPGIPATQPRQRELHLHAALVAQQLVPFVDHHQAQRAQRLPGIVARKLQREALGRGDQHRRHAPVLCAALGRRGVAAAGGCAPVGLQRIEGLLQRAQGIGGQGAHRGQPKHRQRRRLLARGRC